MGTCNELLIIKTIKNCNNRNKCTRDKTIDNKITYIPIDDRQITPYLDKIYWFKTLFTTYFEQTNQIIKFNQSTHNFKIKYNS